MLKVNRKCKLASLLCVLLVLLSVSGGTVYLVGYALSSSDRPRSQSYVEAVAKYPELRPWLDSLNACGALRDTFVTMPTGQRAHALFVRSPRSCGRTAVVVHGYKCDATSMLHIGRMYERAFGYNILLPDLHGHGLSDGDDIQMGWKDRLDVMHWISLAPSVFGVPAQSMRLVVHGISMGAATTMCVSGEPTPQYVRCFVEDCGYTSAWDEFAHELKGRFSLPAFPLLYTASWLTSQRYGWSFGQASPLAQVAKCAKPMLFIHGGSDTFVPMSMVYPLYKAKPRPKALWVARGSGHAMAYKDHKAEYTDRVGRFLATYNR